MADKTYNCKKCKTKHAPPTGKNCQVNNEPSLGDVLAAIKGIQSQMDAVVDRVSTLEATSDQGDAEVESVPGSVEGDQPQEPGLQAKVKARMAELNLMPDIGPVDIADHATLLAAPGGTARGKKSGRARTADDTVSNDIDWPHFYVYQGAERRAAKYEDLNVQEFVFGYLQCVLSQTPDVQVYMYKHLSELMRDAMDYTWPTVRNYHSIILHHMETGRLAWHQRDDIQELRRLYSQRAAPPPPAAPPNQATPSPIQGPIFCLPFQRGACSHQGDHQTNRGPVHHVCAYCLKKTGKTFPHAESDCRRKKFAEKNE